MISNVFAAQWIVPISGFASLAGRSESSGMPMAKSSNRRQAEFDPPYWLS
jgi:hypothetical protein